MSDLLIQRPSLALLGFEPWRAAFEFASHKLGRWDEPLAPGDGHPVIVFPGMASDGTATAPLRQYCESLGYQAFDWGRGFNTGPQGNIDAWLAELAAHTARMLAPFDQSATLIGWSLGIGRIGSVIGPLVGGHLIALNWSNESLFHAAAVPVLCSALLVIALAATTRQRGSPSEPRTA